MGVSTTTRPAAPEPGAAAPVAGEAPDGPRPGPRRPPGAVWAATVLFGLVTALWTVAVPAFRAPDEAAHLDLVLYLAEGHGYPAFDGRFFGEAVGLDTDRHLIELSRPWPRFAAADAPPRSSRPDVEDLGGTTPDDDARRNDPDRAGAPRVYNQMPQHPPLYYLGMAQLLRLERWLLPGDGLPSLDRELGLLRLADVALVTPLPLLAWATVSRLGGDDRAGTVAALLPLGVPQLTHIGGALNNDDLFTPLGALLAVLLAGVGRGRRSRRTDVAVGVVLGLALLTKAFAVMLVPWVAAAYLLGALSGGPTRPTRPTRPRWRTWRTWPTWRRWRAWLGGALVAGGVAVAVGGWWWLANWARYGEPAPTSETLTRTAAQRPPGFAPDALGFLAAFPARVVSRTWAWVGVGTPKVELPPAVVVVLTIAVVVTTTAALVAGGRGLAIPRRAGPAGPGPEAHGSAGPRRCDLVLAWLPTLLVVAFVLRRALGLYETTGKVAFVQGRYLFGALVAAMAVVAVGASHLLGRAAPAVTLAVVAALQAATLALVLDASWTGPAPLGPVRGMLAWAPWPPVLVLAVAAGALVLTGGLALVLTGGLGRRAACGLRPRRP